LFYFKGGTRTDNRSRKSSDNSSSGNGSDIELLKATKRNSNRYKHNDSSSTISLSSLYKLNQQQPPQRSLDKVPSDLRNSKQSFRMAMGNPCEFFIDVM
jgi:segment polarity protein dishevelled